MSKYNEVKVTKAKGKKSEEVSASAFQMIKGAYALGGLFPNVVKKDEPDVMETCDVLVNLWTNKKVAGVKEEETRKAMHGSDIDDAFIAPMTGESKIMDKEMRKQLILSLPARCQGYPWKMAFNTDRDGFSLAEMYRRMTDVHSMVLIIIEDMFFQKFGAILTDKPEVKDQYYGRGESFLFTFRAGDFKTFKWIGENEFFIRCYEDSVTIGAGDGHFGLTLDGDLNRGTSEKCLTFSNEPLTVKKDFKIRNLECWAFEIQDE
ncbi:unnamed protein product [Cyprideis torosa]|uniref:Oxidation resistance protein 1 n=1 Tax=Cyprideis torosa TaxID=163714 RepID=A0A7R8WJD5_9CRUS|nr:unnamed protein product [Cyprideis torosa]CAG0899990.1 unnamed protein product [Cyprideis torosa]